MTLPNKVYILKPQWEIRLDLSLKHANQPLALKLEAREAIFDHMHTNTEEVVHGTGEKENRNFKKGTHME